MTSGNGVYFNVDFDLKTVDDLRNALDEFRKKHENMPIYGEQHGCVSVAFEYMIIEPESGDDDKLNANLPRRLILT